jgi:hypothetical protein
MEFDEFEATGQKKKAFISRITMAKQDFPGLEADMIPTIQNIGCLWFHDTGQKIGLMETIFNDSSSIQ